MLLASTSHALIEAVSLTGNDYTQDDIRLLMQLPHLKTISIDTHEKIDAKTFQAMGDIKSIEVLDLSRYRQLSEENLAIVAQLPSLRVLNLANRPAAVTGKVIATYLSPARHLTDLNLDSCNVSDDDARPLLTMTWLKKLVLNRNPLSNSTFVCLPLLDKLETLEVATCKNIDPQVLATTVNALSELKRLNITFCSQLDDAFFAAISTHQTLRELEASNLTLLGDDGIEAIARILTLEKVILKLNRRASAEGLGKLSGLPELHYLNLEACKTLSSATFSAFREKAPSKMQTLILNECPGVNDQALKWAGAAMPALKRVELTSCTGFSSKGLAHLGPATALQELHLAHCNGLDDDAMIFAATRKNLVLLDVSFCSKMTGKGLHAITSGTDLTEFGMSGCHFPDEAMSGLASWSRLRTLRANWCNNGQNAHTDATLGVIASMPSLEVVELTHNNHYTAQGVLGLADLPRLHTLLMHPCKISLGEVE